MSKHGQEYNERTPAPGVEEVVQYLMSHIGWEWTAKESEQEIRKALTTLQQEKEALVREIIEAGDIGSEQYGLCVAASKILAIAARHGINIQ